MIGLGFSGGLMSGFKAIVLWVPAPRRALANACVMSFGALGPADGDGPDRACGADDGLAHAVHRPCRGHARPWRCSSWPRARAEGAVDRRIARPAGAAAHRHLPGQGVPRHRTAAGHHRRAPTSPSRPCGRARGCAMSPASTGSAWPTTCSPWAWPSWSASSAAAPSPTGSCAAACSELAVMTGFLAAVPDRAARHRAGDNLLRRWPSGCVFGMSGQLAILAYPWLSSRFGAALSGRANTAMNLLHLPRRVRHPVRDRRHHRPVPAGRRRGLRPEVLPGGVRGVPGPAGPHLRASSSPTESSSGLTRSDVGKADPTAHAPPLCRQRIGPFRIRPARRPGCCLAAPRTRGTTRGSLRRTCPG